MINNNCLDIKMCIQFVFSCCSGESDEDISFSKRIDSLSIASNENSITFDHQQFELNQYGINLAVVKPANIAIYKK